ncbi:hypothetical protein [Rheinheimera sp. 4Y26]|uniref:hypothetical protein n=1 Tax=Rheinheimera sp. 4Y26 TaxID=2977811 RepID=UPI0021B0F701|nr:hypothetical protein [Rheinheimera sp. 4Y26]MCT6698394.1 hypothetical protein [Rheinheimera sp. 4Y26]
MSHCRHCEEVNQSFRIENPGDLSKAIRVVSDNLEDGTIIQDVPEMGGFTSVQFRDLAKGELWDDIVEYNFICPECKQKYCLRAETYHGSGGSWSPRSS